jgi:hypothetical protein
MLGEIIISAAVLCGQSASGAGSTDKGNPTKEGATASASTSSTKTPMAPPWAKPASEPSENEIVPSQTPPWVSSAASTTLQTGLLLPPPNTTESNKTNDTAPRRLPPWETSSSDTPPSSPLLPPPPTNNEPSPSLPSRPVEAFSQNSAAATNSSPTSPAPTSGSSPLNADVPMGDSDSDSPSQNHWLFMRALDQTGIGGALQKQRTSIYGWADMAFTGSNAATANTPFPSDHPIGFADRANTFNLQQLWVTLNREVDTQSSTWSVGGRIDFMYGTDYRYLLMRGLFNDQLTNAAGNQNYYGFDLPQFYGSIYMPTFGNGLEIRVGRIFNPWGMESNEAVNTPFLSRSYAMTYSPFTEFGVMGILSLNTKWQLYAMIADGSDVWVGDPSQQWRFVGKVQFTSENKNTTLAFGTTVGQADLNTGAPFAPTTLSTPFEPFGRNNLNAIDGTWTERWTDRLSTGVEGLFGWQYAPAGTPGFPNGHAEWFSVAAYVWYQIAPKWTLVSRDEFFQDFQGQRTGFVGLYSAATLGLQWSPCHGLLVRPELRYDVNSNSTPFDNGTKDKLFTAAVDVILRF